MMPDNQHKLLGLPINYISRLELLEEIEYRLKHQIKTIIYGICVGAYSRLKGEKKDLPYFLSKMDIIVPDGSAIPLFGKIFNVPVGEVIPITEFSLDVLKIANDNKLKVFLLGAEEDVNQQAVKNLRQKFPNALIPKGINGYYNKNDELEIVNRINSEKPDILLIGMTYPLKEEFSIKYKKNLYPTIIIPCGGAIDVFAGKTKRPPKIIKKLMLTWLYRWIQEPKRLIIRDKLKFLFLTFPYLVIIHLLSIEKNPSLVKRAKFIKQGESEIIQ